MKTILYFCLVSLLWSAQLLHAQSSSSDSQPKTLLTSIKKPGFFAAPMLQYAIAEEGNHTLAGLKAGAHFGDKWSVGVQYLTSIDEAKTTINGQRLDIDQQMVGGFVEYRLLSDGLVHLSFPLLLGSAEAELDTYRNGAGRQSWQEQRFFFIEPGVLANLNVTKQLIAFGGLSYRWVTDNDDSSVQLPFDQTLRAFSISAGIKFSF
jgi:hypothetical protein